MTRKKSDDAVSPVIGVMLMLVVVIIVGAVITIFATGMVEDVEAAPIAKLDVEIISNQEVSADASSSGTVPSLHLTHVSGDPLDTADLKLTFTWYCELHDTRHSSSYQYTGKERWGEANDKEGEAAFKATEGEGLYGTSGYDGNYVEPLYINFGWVNPDESGGSYAGAYFGSHILKRGETMMAYDLHLTPESHSGNPAMDALFNNGEIITKYETGVELMPCTKGTPLNNVESITYNGVTYENPGLAMIETYINQGMPENLAKMIALKCSKSCYDIVGECTADPDTEKCLICGMSAMCPGTSHFYTPDYSGKCTISGCGYNPYSGESGFSAGIMDCLPEGTAVNVVITHIPSSQIIYDEKVFVE